MNPNSLTFRILKTLWELYDDSTWTYRHPWSALSSMPEYQKLKRKELYDRYYYLVKKQYLCKIGERYELTGKAKDLLQSRNFEKIIKSKNKKWDKRWRIVIFDVPETAKAKRKRIRSLLNQLEFKMIQKSVWLSPFDLLGEVEELAREENLLKYILLVETSKISKFSEFEKEFFQKNR